MPRNEQGNKSIKAKRFAAGFTVTELMVAVSLMTLIVLALYSMFNQTQKAMRANEAQVDSAERGRGVMELVSRELESARVGLRQDATNLWLRTLPVNFKQNEVPAANPPAANADPSLRTNAFDTVYYLTKADKGWRGVGYGVFQVTNQPGNKKELLMQPTSGLGTLYRYETSPTNRDYAFPTTNLFRGFWTNVPSVSAAVGSLPAATNFSQIAEGIVHFRVLPYDTKGELMAFYTTNIDSTYRMIRTSPFGVNPYPKSNISRPLANHANVVLEQGNVADPLNSISTFRSNALPAYLELELGVLEPDALRIYKQMMKDEQGQQAKAFLERRIAKVQIFRKRIPLRTVAQ